MRCKKCKAKISKGNKFCRKCGEPVRPRKKWPIVLAIAIVAIAAIGIGLLFVLSGINTPGGEIDAENDYIFKESVIKETDAATSSEVTDTQQTFKELDDRGFSDVRLTTNYEMSGAFFEERELGRDADEKHPLYNAYYLTPDGKLWVIYVCNGSYMANPFYTYEANKPQILLIEDDYVTSYKSSTNMFIQTIPDASEVSVVKVERINAETLNGFDESLVGAER